MEHVLRTALSSQVKISPDSVRFLASVLAELYVKELENFDEVQTLLEPFLLDALSTGRDKPEDRRRKVRVEAMCQDVFERLMEDLGGSRGKASATLQADQAPVDIERSSEDTAPEAVKGIVALRGA